jgi:putative restriction endonuclease
MKGYVANTDFDWYSYLKQQTDLEEVNFWQPSGGTQFRAVPIGAPFFFKLKRPHYAIAGFGFLAHTSILPAWFAWDSFGGANGAQDFDTMRRRIEKYRKPERIDPHGQYQIGCLLVTQPVFFDEWEWIAQPKDWSREIVQGKTYDLTLGEGRRVWDECRQRIAARAVNVEGARALSAARYGDPVFVRPRLGQGTFRVEVTDAYGRACAVTGEHSLPVLEAAHIKPYAQEGDHKVSNGLLIRSDIHALFDRGYVTVTREHRFEVSRQLKQDFDNGKSYYPLHGNLIHLPRKQADRPDPALLEWHNIQVFRR